MNSLYPSGLPIKDNQGHTYNVQIALTIQDDTSNSSVHSALVTNMVTSGGVDFVLNANPSFAVNEAQIVSSANKINIHAVTGNPNVFALQLPGVYTVAPTADTYVTNLFQEYRINSFKELVFVERSDNDELYQACHQAAILSAKANLLSYVEVKYTAGANMTAVAMSINSTTTVDALVGCMTSEEALTLYKILDNFRKPIKSLYFLNGPGNSTWTAQLGGLSEYVTSGLAIWTSTLTNAQDELFGTTTTAYTTAFSTWAGVTTPTDHNAGASAAGYALYYAIMNAFSLCDLSNTGGSAYQMLYGTLNCSDNQNNGMKRVISTLQLESVTTFFGNIAFNKNGENYDAVPEVIQVFTVTQDLKVVNAPAVVLPSSKAQQTITIPQPNRYAPVCPAGTIQNPNDYNPCIPCPTGYYQSSVGQTACQICANDYYANETGSSACYACPANTITLNKGTANPDDCLCQVGYYNEEKSGGYACQACPNAANCNGGTSWPSPQAGWYAQKA
ncbi:hypothetical protein CEUSTIGMA_g3779.t1 [Chlamydomonas eustigma]|uniref:Tyrosine-protein kinase ephrin type A/B receptor-like domain-containing protein n=1 Tax=Chlamydomonas eustigma TaxID=1157962 RepID=A0A250WZR2_9CHLO|nr:hypothetical protein CEUSTIGMA_g3779.t1 [Chlamydomonas eustigma]|eukprot:GAX76333.1 hypothetical protein CEUSTIGMA_g3779.t1 [Chlamydomonas eustigma]